MSDERFEFVVASNRLPVDYMIDDDGSPSWRTSPGGLVTALEPVMRDAGGAWVGWGGQADLDLDPFEWDGIRIVPVKLSADDLENFYEGFSNDTLWPLYHDVIAPPASRITGSRAVTSPPGEVRQPGDPSSSTT